MLVTECSRPAPRENKIADLEKELTLARTTLKKYNEKNA
jgi:hypothetical protein